MSGPGASAAQMHLIRRRVRYDNVRGRCQGCRKPLETGEPVVRCGPRSFICDKCSDAGQPLRCRNCRRVVTEMFGYRVKYGVKSAIICSNCRDRSKLAGLPATCRGCHREIAAGEPLVYCGYMRYICRACADATTPNFCIKCKLTVTGQYIYLNYYVGQRHALCLGCSMAVERQEAAA